MWSVRIRKIKGESIHKEVSKRYVPSTQGRQEGWVDGWMAKRVSYAIAIDCHSWRRQRFTNNASSGKGTDAWDLKFTAQVAHKMLVMMMMIWKDEGRWQDGCSCR